MRSAELFCPPEVAVKLLAGEKTSKAEPSLDIWQLGMILYFMFMRALPFDGGENDHEILERIPTPDSALSDPRPAGKFTRANVDR